MKKHSGSIHKMSLVKTARKNRSNQAGQMAPGGVAPENEITVSDIFQDPRSNNDRRQHDMALLCPSPDRRRHNNRRKLSVINENWWMYRRYTPLSYSSL